MSPKVRTVVLWLVLVVVCLGIATVSGQPELPEAAWSNFSADIAADQVMSVRVVDDGVEVTRADGERYHAVGVLDGQLWSQIDEAGVPMTWEHESLLSGDNLIVMVVPAILLIAALIYFVRRQTAAGGVGSVLDLRKSKARLVATGVEKTRFTDVGGAAEAKERLADVIDYLRHPDRWRSTGARLPRGVLLEGPPGCGKTLIARAVAGEAGVPFYTLSASEFVEMFVGVGAARVRDLFETARKAAPAVVFIDELDAVGRRRGAGLGSSHDEREQTLNQLLVCLDGFDRETRVVVIAATNRLDVLDRALLRPGRFDLHLHIAPLDRAARLEALRIHTRDKKLDPSVSLVDLAERTAGCSGADLDHLCNEAALAAVRRMRREAAPETPGARPAITLAPALVGPADVNLALAPLRARERTFDAVDAVLLESASQLTRPTGRAHVRVVLLDGTEVDGDVIWADSAWIKVGTEAGTRLLPKAQIRTVLALEGTVAATEVAPDPWAGRTTGLA